MPKNNKLPPEIIEHWPEVFEHVEIKAIPLEYLDSVDVHFLDGKVWNIDLKKEQEKAHTLEETLGTFFKDYGDVIKSIDFSLNTARVKKDVQARTRSFMKKRK